MYTFVKVNKNIQKGKLTVDNELLSHKIFLMYLIYVKNYVFLQKSADGGLYFIITVKFKIKINRLLI